MDNPNITMEEYIRLEEEKTQRHGQTFNWQTSTFEKVKNYEDEDEYSINFETDFLAIVFDNTLTANSYEPTVCPPNENELDFKISLDESDDEDYTRPRYIPILRIEHMAPLPAANQRHPWLSYQIEEYIEDIRRSYEQRLETIWSRPVNRVHVLDFEGLTTEMRQDLAVRLRMVYSGEGQMSDIVMDLDTVDTLCFQLGGVRRRMTWRQFILALGLHTEDFLGPSPSYVLIRDPVRRLCHKMISYSISAQYLFRHAEGRKSGARLSGGHFIGCLAMHFGLVSDERLRGLQVVTRELLLIDLHELRRLHICTRYGDTWTWVAQGPERQQAAAAGTLEANEVAQEIPILAPTPAQAPPPPPPAPQPRTMS
ncbi:hypothetical protein Tco_1330332 [Tanacetum coccineum]